MPLIDLLRPGIAHHTADIGRADRIIADLGVTVGMAVDAAAEMMRQHLGAEADAEKRLLLPERHGEPIDLAPDEIGGVVRAHGAAERDGAGMAGHGLGQRIAEARATHVERIAALAQGVADASGGRRLLVQHDQNRLEHSAVMASTAVEPQYPLDLDFQDASRTPAMQPCEVSCWSRGLFRSFPRKRESRATWGDWRSGSPLSRGRTDAATGTA